MTTKSKRRGAIPVALVIGLAVLGLLIGLRSNGPIARRLRGESPGLVQRLQGRRVERIKANHAAPTPPAQKAPEKVAPPKGKPKQAPDEIVWDY
jgi:hypothetical protein